MNISELCGLVIPTHMSQKGRVNAAFGPPKLGWVQKTLESLQRCVPATRDLETWVVMNSHPERPGDAAYISQLRCWCATKELWLHIDDSPGYRGVRCNLINWFPKKYLFLVEHDWEFLEDIQLEHIIRAFEENEGLNYMRFNKRPNTVFPKPTSTGRTGSEIYCSPITLSGIPMCATPNYSNNPHIERMSKYRNWVDIVKKRNVHVGGNMGAGGFEHPLQEQSLDDLERWGQMTRDREWGTFIYGGLNHPAVIQHFGV